MLCVASEVVGFCLAREVVGFCVAREVVGFCVAEEVIVFFETREFLQISQSKLPARFIPFNKSNTVLFFTFLSSLASTALVFKLRI